MLDGIGLHQELESVRRIEIFGAIQPRARQREIKDVARNLDIELARNDLGRHCRVETKFYAAF